MKLVVTGTSGETSRRIDASCSKQEVARGLESPPMNLEHLDTPLSMGKGRVYCREALVRWPQNAVDQAALSLPRLRNGARGTRETVGAALAVAVIRPISSVFIVHVPEAQPRMLP